MRCRACNRELNTIEISRKDPNGEPEWMCTPCLSASLIAAGIIEEPINDKEVHYTREIENQLFSS